jgi:hypothetical protein
MIWGLAPRNGLHRQVNLARSSRALAAECFLDGVIAAMI